MDRIKTALGWNPNLQALKLHNLEYPVSQGYGGVAVIYGRNVLLLHESPDSVTGRGPTWLPEFDITLNLSDHPPQKLVGFLFFFLLL